MVSTWTKLIITFIASWSFWTQGMGDYIEITEDDPPVYYAHKPSSTVSGQYYVTQGRSIGCNKDLDDPDGDCIPGHGGRDYPIYTSIPKSRFSCKEVPYPGYYADVDNYCQVFHICEASGRQHSMLCPKGTIFKQESLVCDWWYSVDCSASYAFYGENENLYGGRQSQPHSNYGQKGSYELPYDTRSDYVTQPNYEEGDDNSYSYTVRYNRRSDSAATFAAANKTAHRRPEGPAHKKNGL